MIYGALASSALPSGLAPSFATRLVVNGEDQAGRLVPGGISVSREMGARTTLKATLLDKENGYEPQAGWPVSWWWRGALAFSGTIDRVTRKELWGTEAEAYELECVDFSQILDRRLVAATYETPGQLAGEIVADIVADLADEGLTPGQIEDGVQVTKAVFPYIPASQAIQELADLSGMTWSVDAYKRVHFSIREVSPSSVALSDTSRPFRDLQVEVSRAAVKNRIYLKAGKSKTDELTEYFNGDGQRRTFTTGYPLAAVPTIQVDTGGGYVTKSVGIRGVDTGKNWYWQKDNNQLTQDTGAAVLSAGHTLKVVYFGLFPLRLEGTEDGSVAERAALEGGTGYYEAVEEDERIEERDMAVEKMRQLLRRFSYPPTIATFKTYEENLTSGQTFSVALTEEDLAGTFLVLRAEHVYRWEAGPDGQVVTTITSTDGEYTDNWLGFYRKLEAQGRKFSIRENEGLGLGPTKFDYVELGDSHNTTDPIDDGSNDPYSGLQMAGDASADEEKRAIGAFVIGGGLT